MKLFVFGSNGMLGKLHYKEFIKRLSSNKTNKKRL